jgi:chaperonin GroES
MKQIAIPLGNRIIIKEIPRSEVSKGGIIIPDTVQKEVLVEGEAIAIGDKVEQVKDGDIVLYSGTAGADVNHDEKDCVIVFETDVWCILKTKV